MNFGRAKGPPKPPAGRRSRGRIARLAVGQSHGFIRLRDGQQVYFHRADLRENTAFNGLRVGDRVDCEVIDDAVSGARAVDVRRTPL